MHTGYEPKIKVVPHLLKGFFTDEELEVLLAIIKYQKKAKDLGEFYSPLILPTMARMQIEVMYPESIRRKLEGFASELVGEEVFMSHNSYLSYNQEHSPGMNPKLPPHFDSDNYYSKLTMDYQLDTNIDWPIVIGEKSFNLKYGDLLVFWGAGNPHWREPVLFKDGDNTEVLTMHFSNKEDFEKLNKSARDPEERKKRLDRWNADPTFERYQKEYSDKESKITNK